MKSLAILTALPVCILTVCLASAASAEPVSFRQDIAPMLLNNCLACHGPRKAEGAYRVDSFERFVKEGDSGAAAISGKDIDDSEAFRRIVSEDVDERMPLEGDPLPKDQLALLKRWIEEGATFDGPDATANLASIVPPPVHPKPPEAYPNSLPITALAFSPDGNELIAGGYHELTVWNPADGQLLRRIENIGQRTYALDISPDGKLLAVGCGAPGRLGETRLIDPAGGQLVKVLGSTTDVVLDVAFNPAGDRLAVTAADGVVRLFAVESGEEQLAITSHSDWVMAVAWNADGSKLATASRDKTAKVFDAQSGELLATYSGHGQPVKGVAFHPDGNEVYSGGGDKKIHRWKIADAKKSAELAFGDEVYKLVLGGDSLFAASADKSVRQFEAKSHKQTRSYAGHKDWALATAFHEATNRLASGAFDGWVRVWNVEDGKEVTSFLAAPGYAPPQPK